MLAWGTTSITGVAYFSAESPSPLIFFYLWIFLYSAYFFDDRITLLQVAYSGVTLGALLIALPPDERSRRLVAGLDGHARRRCGPHPLDAAAGSSR